jgi:uncharacterized SAM-binding protein YcdF (DUF218 family)
MSGLAGGAPRWDPVWRLKIRPVRVFAALAVIALALVLATPSIMTAYARWLICVDPPTHADVAVVLGGGEGERLRAALQIWREGRVPAILITGPAVPLLEIYTGEESLTQGEVRRRIAVHKGVPESKVWLLTGPTSTYEEAVAVRAELERRGLNRAIIVTSPLHSRRAGRTFRHVLKGSPIVVTLETLSPERSEDRPREWWTREHDTLSVFSETLKLLYYWNRYGIAPV